MKLSVAIIKSRGVPSFLGDENIDGGTRNLIETARAFTQKGLDVNIFTSSPELAKPSSETVDGIEIHRLPLQVNLSSTGIALDLERAEIFAKDLLHYAPYCDATFDFLHTHHWTSASPTLLRHPRHRTRHIHTPHLLVSEKLRHLGLPMSEKAVQMEKTSLEMADRIIAVSRSEAQVLGDNYVIDSERIVVIPNGISAEFLAHKVSGAQIRERLRTQPVRLVSVGRLVRQKGFDLLLNAVALGLKEGIDVHCTIVGGPYHSEPSLFAQLVNQVDDLGIAGHVTFVGHCSTLEVMEQLCASSIYVQPTRYESQGLAILEAMSVGLPVIVSRIPAVMEFVKDGLNGILVAPEEPAAIVKALSHLVTNQSTAVAMASANRRSARHMDWGRTCQLTCKSLGL